MFDYLSLDSCSHTTPYFLVTQCSCASCETVLNPFESGELSTKFKDTFCMFRNFKFHGKADLQANTCICLKIGLAAKLKVAKHTKGVFEFYFLVTFSRTKVKWWNKSCRCKVGGGGGHTIEELRKRLTCWTGAQDIERVSELLVCQRTPWWARVWLPQSEQVVGSKRSENDSHR